MNASAVGRSAPVPSQASAGAMASVGRFLTLLIPQELI
jgi:hypothetical protein